MCGHQQGNSKIKSCKDTFPKKLRLQDKPKRKEPVENAVPELPKTNVVQK